MKEVFKSESMLWSKKQKKKKSESMLNVENSKMPHGEKSKVNCRGRLHKKKPLIAFFFCFLFFGTRYKSTNQQ